MEEHMRWNSEDVKERLDAVRDTLVAFLQESNRLDRYKRRERWRLMRQYIWPGAPDDFRQMLESTVDTNAGAQAILRHLEERKREITSAIERYNHGVRRCMEQQLDKPVARFEEDEKEELNRRQITFAGARDELLRKSRALRPDSPPEIVGEILSLRIAILPAGARDLLFREVAAARAEELAREREGMEEMETELEAFSLEWNLRIRDRYYVARLLAGTYEESRWLLRIDLMLDLIDRETESGKENPGEEQYHHRRVDILRGCTRLALEYLEELWPSSGGAHEKLIARL